MVKGMGAAMAGLSRAAFTFGGGTSWLARIITGSAGPMPVRIHVCVDRVIRVPLRAVRLVEMVIASVAYAVLLILGRSPVLQVLKTIIGRFTVKVTNHHAGWRRPNKCRYDHLVGINGSADTVSKEIGAQVALTVGDNLQDSGGNELCFPIPLRHSSFFRANRAPVGHRVGTFVSRHRQPSLGCVYA